MGFTCPFKLPCLCGRVESERWMACLLVVCPPGPCRFQQSCLLLPACFFASYKLTSFFLSLSLSCCCYSYIQKKRGETRVKGVVAPKRLGRRRGCCHCGMIQQQHPNILIRLKGPQFEGYGNEESNVAQ